MTEIGCAPTWPVDGPVPSPPPYSLLSASRIVDDLDQTQVERWLNGVEVYPYVTGTARGWDAMKTGSNRLAKDEGDAISLPSFGALTVYLPETCSSFGIWGGGMSPEQAQDRFVARATAALAAVESAAIESELMSGDALGLQPHLGDGNGSFPNGNTATSVTNAIALLENEIAGTGRQGVIHCSPAFLTFAAQNRLIGPDPRGPGGNPVLRTINGTVVVPGYGYVGQSDPDGRTASSTGQEWVYATGPVEVRRSPLILVPETVVQALDRAQNSITYRVERYVVASWDVVLQAAVLADLCMDTCT